MKNFSDRLRKLRTEANLSQGGLAYLCGWGEDVKESAARISNYESENPKSKRNPKYPDVVVIAEALTKKLGRLVTAEFLLNGSEPLHPSPLSDNVSIRGIPHGVDARKVPLLEWNQVIKYKQGKLNMDEIRDYTFVNDASLSHCISLEIQTDEMTTSNPKESYMRGEVIIVDLKEKYRVNDFVIAHIKSSGEIIFKQYIKYADKHYLKSLNSQYPLIEITDDIEIIGVMMEVHNIRKARR